MVGLHLCVHSKLAGYHMGEGASASCQEGDPTGVLDHSSTGKAKVELRE